MSCRSKFGQQQHLSNIISRTPIPNGANTTSKGDPEVTNPLPNIRVVRNPIPHNISINPIILVTN